MCPGVCVAGISRCTFLNTLTPLAHSCVARLGRVDRLSLNDSVLARQHLSQGCLWRGSPPIGHPACLLSLAQRQFRSKEQLQRRSITQEELHPVSQEGLQQPNSVVCLLGKLEVTIPCIYTTLSTIGEGDRFNATKQTNHSCCSAAGCCISWEVTVRLQQRPWCRACI